MSRSSIRIGCGAGYSGDRIEPALELAEHGRLDYLIFECLAERTIALAQQARARDPQHGYDPLLVDRLNAVLEPCHRNRVRLLTNMGAANPLAAARVVRDVAIRKNLRGLTVAAVTGDDVLEEVRQGDYTLRETGERLSSLGVRLISANAYIGAAGLVEALTQEADVVVTGRAADPSLFLAAQIHAFGWAHDDWARLGRGTILGHLLECAGQVTGGYFADPEVMRVPDLARLGFPIAEITPDGNGVVTKVQGSGGLVTTATCKAQLLYELHDPSSYLTPDVTADFSEVRVADDGQDRVRVAGGSGRARPDLLKVSVGYTDGFIGEGQISYAGPGALARARLACEIVRDRLAIVGATFDEIRYDLIGMNALHGPAAIAAADAPDVRVRVAARTRTRQEADRITQEVETLYTNGPAAGGGATRATREVLAIGTTFVPRDLVKTQVHIEKVS